LGVDINSYNEVSSVPPEEAPKALKQESMYNQDQLIQGRIKKPKERYQSL